MNTLRLLLLLLGTGLPFATLGQVTRIALALEVEGHPQPLEEFNAQLMVAGDTLRARGPSPYFEVPERLYGQKGTVWVASGRTHLRFATVPVVWNRQVPRWTFGVDRAPFDRHRVWGKTPRRARTAYLLDNSIGITYSYFD
ncbi:hypothetical protein [Hymenobacter sp. UYCo722]|uniref:hypothetical protein n=1 Tax=Hymenobacter sp. UYCo722 TaxID=3156335 RepID=UPI0033910609